MDLFHNPQVNTILRYALEEDIGTGDITSLATIAPDAVAHGRFIMKEDAVICGLPVCGMVFSAVDEAIRFAPYVKEGSEVQKGEVVAEVEGNAVNVLTAERTALNFLQRLSGIATRTAQSVKAVEGTGAKITDTRKTTPGLRVLEKYAVKTGGGTNHRFNLADGVLIKDNHIAAAGGITKAVEAARKNAPHTLKIEVEVETFDELSQAIDAHADIIMLDNMTVEDMAKAVKIINGRALVEASGNMGEKDLLEVAKTGVDIISIGALTHSVRAVDISLKFNLL